MRVLVATNNAKKRKELDSILHALGVETVTPAELGINCEVEETGETFEENAMLKAKNGAILAGIPAIADDSGLMVDTLGGRPGVYSARYGGEGLDDAGRTLRLLCELKGVTARGAKFVSAIAYYANDGDCFTVRGECAGRIADAPHGAGGFGYDPIFYVPEYGMTYSEMDPELKNRISHRGVALARFCERLKQTREKDGSQ